MVNKMEIRNAVGIVGDALSFGIFLAPMPTFRKICKNKSVEQFSPVPYLATLLNCGIWVLYGLPFVSENNMLIYVINGIGVVLESAYIIIFLVYSPPTMRARVTKILAIELVFYGLVVAVVAEVVHTMKTRGMIVGILAVIFGTCMYASPLSVMRLVIQTRSVRYMPFFLSLVSFLNGLCWTSYAFLQIDIFQIIPNVSGAVLGFAQLVLYACYYSSTPREEPEVQVTVQPAQGAPATVVQITLQPTSAAPATSVGPATSVAPATV